MKRQLLLASFTTLSLGVGLYACNEPEVSGPAFSPAGTSTGTGTGTGTATTTGTTTGTGTATGAGTTTGAGTGTGTGSGTGSGSGTGTGSGTGSGTGTGTGGTCVDNDYTGWVGGGPGCIGGAGGTGGTGGSGFDAPNAETNAVYLGEIEDDDDCGGVVSGVINGNTDVDWYYYHGTDHVLALVDPVRDRQQDQDLQICAYVDCDNGETDPGVSCTDSQPDQSGQGLDGCCTDGNATSFEIGFCCTTGCLGSEDANLYISVAGPTLGSSACVDYEILFHY